MLVSKASAALRDMEDVERRISETGSALGRPLFRFAGTTSTNDEAKHAAKAGAEHGATFVADSQTAGRGRQGRSWVAGSGEALLFSIVLRAPVAPARVPPLALVAGLAVRDAVAKAAPGARVTVKWPNDVLIEGRKVAGILVESMTTGSKVSAIVVGIGINVHTRVFPDELRERATSIALHAATPPERAAVLADCLANLDRDAMLALHRGLGIVHGRLTAADALFGQRIKSELGEGVASGIDADGRIKVTFDDGTIVRWSSGEVHLVRGPVTG